MRYQDLKKENKKLWALIQAQNDVIYQMSSELEGWYMAYECDESEWTW